MSTVERPIIMSATSVRAILAGIKTQTRRAPSHQPKPWKRDGIFSLTTGRKTWATNERMAESTDLKSGKVTAREYLEPVDSWLLQFCRIKPGDTLWVKEKHVLLDRDHYHDSGPRDKVVTRYGDVRINGVVHWSGEEAPDSKRCREAFGYKWRSPIHMPQWASRLTLVVENVRAERLQEITESDANREGCRASGSETSSDFMAAVDDFKYRWDCLNAKRGFAWADNPWVWVISFTRAEMQTRTPQARK